MSEQRPNPEAGAPASVSGDHRGTEPPHAPGRNGGPQPHFAPPQDGERLQPAGPGASETVRTAAGADAPPPTSFGAPKGPPSGPPARVGSAVASLIAAVLTLIVPAVFWFMAVPVLSLLVNIPGIVLASIALSKTDDPPELERFMRYAWACTLIYIALMVLIVAAVTLLISMSLA